MILADNLESEVNNGGFDQYYLNSSGDGAFLTPDSMRLLGCPSVADMVEKANAVFPATAQRPPADRALRLAQMSEVEDRSSKVWSALDDEFFNLELPDGGLSVGHGMAYILAHPEEFFRTT